MTRRTRNISRSDFYSVTFYLQHYACFACRKAFKQPFDNERPDCLCPQCRQPMTNMGTDFKTPPHKNTDQWRKVQLLAQAGVKFFPHWSDELPHKRPNTLAEVPAFLRRIYPPSEGVRLLEQNALERQRSPAPREGKLSIQGLAPHQTFRLLGQKIGAGNKLEVLRDEGWREAVVGRNRENPEEPSHLQLFKKIGHTHQLYETVVLDSALRLRWPK